MQRFVVPLCGAVILLGLLVAACGSMEAADLPDEFRVMSFNIRIDTESDGRHAWVLRRDAVRRVLRGYGPALIGFQEVLPTQLRDLLQMLPDHSYTGAGRRASGVGEHTPIFFDKRRFELLDSGMFWLSETPNEPGTRGWDASVTRIATWASLRDRRTARTVFFVNTHLDHRGEQARVESAELLGRKVRKLGPPGAAVIVTADLNATPESPVFAGVVADGLFDARALSSTPPQGPDSTWNGFRAMEPGRRIDFIFVDESVEVLRHMIPAERVGGLWPSDHFPVVADVRVGGW